MRLKINLASKPFVELRPIFARLRIGMAALAVLAIALGVLLHFEVVKQSEAEFQINQLRKRTASFQRERSQNEARMRQPVNASVLQRAQFLNALFVRKGFSWTAVMMDLENVLPAGVQVSSIEPQITKEGDVSIRLRVLGDRDKSVDLIRNLEHSKRFLSPRLASEAMQAQTPGQLVATQSPGTGASNVEFDIISGYNPLPITEADLKSRKTEEEKAKKEEDKAQQPEVPKSPISAKPNRPAPRSPLPAPAKRTGGAR